MSDVDNTVTILVTRNGMGEAEPELAQKLIVGYLDLLELEDRLPRHICFYAEGVMLACDGSPALETLKDLADRGVTLTVCTTCLRFYDLESKLAVGRAGNMQQIQMAQWEASKVITV